MPFVRGTRRTLLSLVAFLTVGGASAAAQTGARVRVEENFRREPNGVILARLSVGAPLRVLSTRGSWSEVELTGSVWLRSLQVSEDPEHDLVVSAPEGENLRAEPAGAIVARLEEGALLQEVERGPAWARVRRVGWIWSGSIDTSAGSVGGPMIQPEAPGAHPRQSGTPAARQPGGFTRVGRSGAPILASAGGDTLAVARSGTDVEVVGREGNWVRVRVDGWMWLPDASQGDTAVVDPTPVALEPADLQAAPSEHVGRVVAWTLQFISLERAEAVRTDFFQGEPFLLARYGAGDGPFVYVAVPPERLEEVDGLVPLERIAITARVRAGASALTGTPIVDLLSLDRSREEP